MTKCSNHAHDKSLMSGFTVSEPDERLADIMALEKWRSDIERFNVLHSKLFFNLESRTLN